MRLRVARTGWLTLCLLAVACAARPLPHPALKQGEGVRLNELQFVGTHNAYHIAPDAALLQLILNTGYQESAQWTAGRIVPAMSYTHRPLAAQLDMGIRVFELDIHDDPDGGRFANPGFLKALPNEVAERLPPVDPQGDLQMPGLKTFHSADIDVRSNCLLFAKCLAEVRDWSTGHPGHAPIFIEIETKEGNKPSIANAYPRAHPAPFGPDAWRRLHAEIEATFPPGSLLTPQEVKGAHASVNAAVQADGWPTLESTRGRVIFVLLDDPSKQDEYVSFTETSVRPILFVSRGPDDPHTAWLIRQDPYAEDIPRLVRQGFIVYTRADADSEEPQRGDHRRADAALASGAQLLSTDYPYDAEGGYRVSFDGAFVRCNPVHPQNDCKIGPQEPPKNRE